MLSTIFILIAAIKSSNHTLFVIGNEVPQRNFLQLSYYHIGSYKFSQITVSHKFLWEFFQLYEFYITDLAKKYLFLKQFQNLKSSGNVSATEIVKVQNSHASIDLRYFTQNKWFANMEINLETHT